MQEDLDDLITSGNIGNNANGLQAKLNQIIAKLDQGNVNAACNQLGAFINQVENIVSNGNTDAQPLLDLANSISFSYC